MTCPGGRYHPPPVELYEQDAEVRLLSMLVSRLDDRTLLDVGAERGAIVEELLRAGVTEAYALEAHPDNATALRVRFADDPRVTVHEIAASEHDGVAELHVSTDRDGQPLSYGHTLLERADTDEIGWGQTLTVKRRSLASLIDAREIPARVGVLKIDTEGHDLAVVHGMGPLGADIVMVEHWTDLPHGLGACPWSTEEMIAAMDARGFAHFAFIVHRAEFVTLRWDDGEVEPGAMGNLVFLHDSVLQRLLPDVLGCATWLMERAVRLGRSFMDAANERLELINWLERAAEDRLELVNQLERVAQDRLGLVHDLEATAETRLHALEAATTRLQTQEAELRALRAKGG
jgi:FkbM family methyltransferase